MAFRVLIIGGTGQVGAAVVRALAAEPSCAEVVMVNRKAIALTADPRVRQVILDTAAAQFPADGDQACAEHGVRTAILLRHPASCVGTGSMKWSRGGTEGGTRDGRGRRFRPAVVTPEVSRSLRCSLQREAMQKAGFAMRGSWG